MGGEGSNVRGRGWLPRQHMNSQPFFREMRGSDKNLFLSQVISEDGCFIQENCSEVVCGHGILRF